MVSVCTLDDMLAVCQHATLYKKSGKCQYNRYAISKVFCHLLDPLQKHFRKYEQRRQIFQYQ